MDRILAVIPARSGSKGLKDKNIKELNGKPLMAYTIEAARQSGIMDCIHVSTDSEQYAQIAREYGADVPFLRQPEYATDKAATWDVVKYVLGEYEARGGKFDYVMLLQPTTPLRTAEDITCAYHLLQEKHANAVVSVCEVDHSPLWTDTIPADGNMKGFVKKEYRELPRQAMPTYYRVNGAIYFVKTSELCDVSNMYDDECYAYIMPTARSVDIDGALDFEFAEALMKKREHDNNK